MVTVDLLVNTYTTNLFSGAAHLQNAVGQRLGGDLLVGTSAHDQLAGPVSRRPVMLMKIAELQKLVLLFGCQVP